MADCYNANFIMCESFVIFVLILFQNLITFHAFFLFYAVQSRVNWICSSTSILWSTWEVVSRF